jgi:Ca2+-binding EF-hand superfamily protein
MDLRVVPTTCAPCHPSEVRRVHASLHATTAGHLSDGFYEMGLAQEKRSAFGVFPVWPHEAAPGDVEGLVQVPPFRDDLPQDELSTHYTDLARKECMQCHLWSSGRAVRGRVGFDGDYRGSGCAACHVAYARDGLSESADDCAVRNEPGHPRVHAMTRAPTTSTCTSCHYGDAAIGLDFRGMAQLPPGASGGPEIPGTTDAPLNRAFYIDDPALTPPDVHHERGMHCIDCHTQNDVMGDGRLYGAMELAVEIACSDCHGTFEAPAKLRTERGTPLAHLRRDGDRVILTSKVDGREHAVVQVVDVLDPGHRDYNSRAARAMTASHARLECYACHASWNPNFLGFHFDRNESLTQLDLLSGKRTRGRVTTQEKVFATWKSFYAGWNESGRIAPYTTGFSTMGSVRDREGEVVIDQALPVTAAGLSGLSMIHHQVHTTRSVGRACIECHRSSSTWGLGSPNFRLARQLALVADRRGIEVVALDRAQLSASAPLAKLVLPDAVAIELDCDPLQGRARRAFVAEGFRGVHVLDLADPTAPARTQFVATVQPCDLELAGDHLFVADGRGGLRVFDARGSLRQVAVLPTFDARAVAVQWPYAYVADGPAGVSVVDVRRPEEPRVAGGFATRPDASSDSDASEVAVLFQYSRPIALDDRPTDRRTRARALCAALDESGGLALFDVTEPSRPEKLYPARDGGSRAQRAGATWRGLALASHVDLAEPQGGSRTREVDLVYALAEREIANGERRSALVVLDVTEPRRARQIAALEAGYATESLELAWFYNPPFLETVLFSPGEQGVTATSATISAEPRSLGVFASIRSAYVVAVEEFPLDRMLDEAGRPLKDVSHAGSRWMKRSEIERTLLVPGEVLGTIDPDRAVPEVPGTTARLYFGTLDLDGSGVVEGGELARAPRGADADGDGRVWLGDLEREARLSAAAGTEAQAAPSVYRATRVDPDGDLARLFDGVNPFEHDADGDRRLDRAELARALFAALDLDRDGALTLDELSRHPGDLRQLRYRGAWAAERFGEVDDNGDGRVGPRELEVAERDFAALDLDSDGYVHLGAKPNPWWERRGIVGPASEWPTRRYVFVHLPPGATRERLLEAFDADRSGDLNARELRRRPELFTELDTDGDSIATAAEIDARVAQVAAAGVDACPDDFVGRYDLDGDGRVGEGELPRAAFPLLSRR